MSQTLNINENANVSLKIRSWWALIVAVFIFGMSTGVMSYRLDYKVERLYVENRTQHESLMVKLEEIDQRQSLFVLKRQLEDAFVFVNRERDKISTTNLVDDELAFRSHIRDFLK
jgi:hypothetical protein